MEKDVMIAIRGLQVMDENNSDSLETVWQGEYFFKNGAHYLLFDEYMEGFKEPVKNVLRFKNNELTLTKRGLLNVQMIFSEGKKNLSNYQTPYGTMMIGMDTTRVISDFSEHAFSLKVDYTLEANYQYVSDSHISIEVQEKAGNTLCKRLRDE